MPTSYEPKETENNVYETDELLNMYLSLHFPSSGKEENLSPILKHENAPIHGLRFPQRVAQLLVSLNPVCTNNRALDVGCAVGGSSFELARTFDHVEAFDFSHLFIANAKKMQEEKEIMFSVPIEGDICETVKAVHEPGLSSQMMQKVHFFVGDACKLKYYAERGSIGTFDGIVMSNLLCRIPNPIECLNGISLVLNKGGVLVMVTPFSWLDQYTCRENWIGGTYESDSGRPVRSYEYLEKLMKERGFKKIHEEEMPLVIREHQRKYQYIVSQASGWRKTS